MASGVAASLAALIVLPLPRFPGIRASIPIHHVLMHLLVHHPAVLHHFLHRTHHLVVLGVALSDGLMGWPTGYGVGATVSVRLRTGVSRRQAGCDHRDGKKNNFDQL